MQQNGSTDLVARMSQTDLNELRHLQYPGALVKYTVGMVIYMLEARKDIPWDKAVQMLGEDFLVRLQQFDALSSLSLEMVTYISHNYLDLYQRQQITEKSRVCGLLYLFILQQTKLYTTEHQIVLQTQKKEEEEQRQKSILEMQSVVVPKVLPDYAITFNSVQNILSFTNPPQGVITTMQMVNYIINNEKDMPWKQMKTLLKKEFIQKIANYEFQQMSPEKAREIENTIMKNGMTYESIMCKSSDVGEMFKFVEYCLLLNLDITREEWKNRMSSFKIKTPVVEETKPVVVLGHPSLQRICQNIYISSLREIFALCAPPQLVKTIFEIIIDMITGQEGNTFAKGKTKKTPSELLRAMNEYEPNKSLSSTMNTRIKAFLEQYDAETVKKTSVAAHSMHRYLKEVVTIVEQEQKVE